MIGELIGAGVSLLGGLFGGKKKTQTTTSEVNYEKMAAKASAAGFNPLTAIRNGGSAGFTTTTSPTISNTPEILSNLGGILGGALGKKLDPIEAKKREIDTLLVDRQLRQLKEGPQVAGGFRQPRMFEGTKVSQQLVPRLGERSHKQTAAVPAAFGPPSPEQFAKENGGLNMYVPYFDRFTNQVHYGPNPDMADLEQFPMPSAIAGASAFGPNTPRIKDVKDRYQRGISKTHVKWGRASPTQNKANREAWHRGWLPSFDFN